MDVEISIIIPLFNAEQWINNIVSILLSEKKVKFEILLIDDGSFDNTLSICYRIAESDNRVKVYHHSNHGVSYTRNRGIDKANGKYILFIDADDIIEFDYLITMYNILIKGSYDCICCNYSYEEEDGNILRFARSTKNVTLTSLEALLYVFKNDFFGGYLWNKIFSREIIKKFNLYFDEDLSIYEDLHFVIRYLSYCTSVRYISYCGYHYIKHTSSAMNLASLKNAYSKVIASLRIYDLEIIRKDISLNKLVVFMLATAFLDFEKVACIVNITPKESKVVQYYLRQKIFSLFRCNYCTKKQKIGLFLCTVLGIVNVAKIQRLLKKLNTPERDN